MSEYQYYEFQALDRRLTTTEIAEIKKLSRRVELSATSAVFNYSYGDFPGDPLSVLADYFDALFYIANWGTHQLAFRFPPGSISTSTLEPYMCGDDEGYAFDYSEFDDALVLTMTWNEMEGIGWIQGEGVLTPLLPLRDAIMRGDLRALYLFWLKVADIRQDYEDTEAEPEPPVPPGLNQLDAPLKALIKTFEIDTDLVAAAARNSPPLQVRAEPLEEWLRHLPQAEKDTFLLQAARGDSITQPLLRRLRMFEQPDNTAATAAPRRDFRELLAEVEAVRAERAQRELAAAERALKARMAELAAREEQIWQSVAQHFQRRNSGGYNDGVQLLLDLRTLADYQGKRDIFTTRLNTLLEQSAKSTALQRRLQEKGLL